MKLRLPTDLKGTFYGYNQLGLFALRLSEIQGRSIELNGLEQWCDAHLCAALGAIVARARDNGNSFILGEDIRAQIKLVWGKNGFYREFGGIDMTDTWDTTLAYERFDASDEKRFAQYLTRELLPKELPKMSASARKHFSLSVQEIFNNAISHSGFQGAQRVFCCGQNYPSIDTIAFSVADLGIGFRTNVEAFLRREEMADCQTIDWAMREGNTTKRTAAPGGLGLTLLWDWIKRNRGRLQIASQSDLWEGSALGITRHQLTHPFPGTVVTLHINTWDDNAYDSFLQAQNTPLF